MSFSLGGAKVMRGALVLAIAAAVILLTSYGYVAAVEGDVVFSRRGGVSAEIPVAVFPHWVHRARFRCYVCHTAIFEMKAGANPVSMDAIGQGKYCGTCHNGKSAFAVGFDTCIRCHRQ
jgi:c(7)-type cytochrome triheme protein